jgi:hypothetical protein
MFLECAVFSELRQHQVFKPSSLCVYRYICMHTCVIFTHIHAHAFLKLHRYMHMQYTYMCAYIYIYIYIYGCHLFCLLPAWKCKGIYMQATQSSIPTVARMFLECALLSELRQHQVFEPFSLHTYVIIYI